MRILAFIPVLAIVACAESSTPAEIQGSSASAAQLLNQKTDFANSFVACNGDVVDLSGTVHTKANFTVTPSGNILASVTMDYNLSGVGLPSGATYTANQRVVQRERASDNTESTGSMVQILLVGQGKVPNTVLMMKTHVVMVDGEMKVSHSDYESRCQGE